MSSSQLPLVNLSAQQAQALWTEQSAVDSGVVLGLLLHWVCLGSRRPGTTTPCLPNFSDSHLVSQTGIRHLCIAHSAVACDSAFGRRPLSCIVVIPNTLGSQSQFDEIMDPLPRTRLFVMYISIFLNWNIIKYIKFCILLHHYCF